MTDDNLTAALVGAVRVAGPDGADPGRRCKAGRILDTVSPANRAAILDLLFGCTTSNARLAVMLRSGGVDIAESTLAKHAGRLCPCTTYAEDEAA